MNQANLENGKERADYEPGQGPIIETKNSTTSKAEKPANDVERKLPPPAPAVASVSRRRRSSALVPPCQRSSTASITSFTQGRVFLPGHPSLDPTKLKARFKTFRVLSYNILAQSRVFETLSYCAPTAVAWERRRALIVKELRSFDAHVVCLQDVDHYHDFWQSALDDLGYDSIFMRRTSVMRKNLEGIVIAWKSHELQAFQMEHVILNDAIKEDPEVGLLKALADDVAILVMLQPKRGLIPCAICVANTQFHSSDAQPTVHLVQARCLARRIERFNRCFQLPVVLSGSLNAPAGSVLYETLASGRKIGTGGVPRVPGRPTLHSLSRSSFMVQWPSVTYGAMKSQDDDEDKEGEEEEEEMAPIIGYWIAYQPGGNSNIGFAFKTFVPEEKCLPSCYPKFKGGTTMLRKSDRLQIVAELTSNVAYEFRIAAENKCGIGPWSLPSEPTETMKVDYGMATARRKEVLSVPELQARRLKEEEKLKARLKAKGLEDNDAMNGKHKPKRSSQGQLPTNVSRLHPYITPSGSQSQFLYGSPNTLVTPVRKHQVQYFPSVAEQSSSPSSSSSYVYNEEDGWNDFTVIQRDGDMEDTHGAKDDAHENSLRLCSAYSTYSAAGEPPYTTLTDKMAATVDYIFHSAESLFPLQLLSLPALEELDGCVPGRSFLNVDHAFSSSFSIAGGKEQKQKKDEVASPTSGSKKSGEKEADRTKDAPDVPNVMLDPSNSMYLIPTLAYPSDHLPLMVELGMTESYTAAQWRPLI